MRPEEDFLFFKVDHSDPQYLRKVLTAHFHHERMQAVRRFFVAVLAVLGVAMGLTEVWPSLVSTRMHALGLQLFVLWLIATVVVGGLEYRWYRLRATLMRAHQNSSR